MDLRIITAKAVARLMSFAQITCVFLPTPTGHTRRPITTVYGSKRVFPRKAFWGF